MKTTLVSFALALVVLAGCGRRDETPAAAGAKPSSGPAAAESTTVGTEVGSVMPDYTAAWLDGSRFDLGSRKGRAVLLNLWATWCGPCRYEIPELQRLHDHYAARGFEVIGVSVDESGVESVQQFVTEQKMTYPVVIDPEGRLAALLQSTVLPTSVLLDREGKILWKRYGAILENDTELARAIEGAVGGGR